MRVVLQQALDALENSSDLVFKDVTKSHLRYGAITAIKQALSAKDQEVSPEQHYMNGFAEGVKRAKAEASSRRDAGKAYEQGRRDLLNEVLRIAPDSVSVLLERLKEGK